MKFRQYPFEQQLDRLGNAVPSTADTSNAVDTQLKGQANQIAASAWGQPGTSKTTTPNQAFSTENVQNMTPRSLAALEQLIATMQGGGTLQQKAEIARKKQTQDLIQQMLGQYSSGQAFTDAQGLMALNLQKAMETNMPQIQRSIEGAGTSAGSMQGLLAQNMARDSALAASALGADQAKSYAGTTAQLTNQLSGMASSALDPVGQQLIAALGIAKGAVSNTQRTTSGGGQTEKIGGTLASAIPFQSPSMLSSGVSSSGVLTGGADSIGTLDPNRYYSQYGMSGKGSSLYDFLTTM